MKTLFPVLLILLLSCETTEKKTGLFEDLADKTSLEIYLKTYGLDSVPKDIGQLKAARRLYIAKDSARGWTIYPPLSALDQRTQLPPFRQLPDEITELTNLESLVLSDLDLKTLPSNFGRLQNLDSLSLFMNKLTLSAELGKLKALKKLKYLEIYGNKADSTDLEELKKAIPGLTIYNGDIE